MSSYISYIQSNTDKIVEYTINQFELVIIVMAISMLLWVPMGMFLSQKRSLAPAVMSVANFIYCTPSLALFVIFVAVPGLGIGRKSAVLALVLYAMMPLVRNVYQGIIGVDKTVIEAAQGMGMNKRQIMKDIIIPLAMPVMFAGFRVTLVMTAGIATIAVYIGEKNLGRFIINGLNRGYIEMIVVGSVLICIISLVLDYGLAFCEKRVVPKGLRVNRS